MRGAPPAAHRQEPGSAPSVSGAPLTDRTRFARTSKLPRAPQRTSASSDVSILSSCERGMPPFTLSPKTRGQRTSFAAISWLRSGTRGTPGAPPAAHRQEPGSAPSVSGAPLTDRTRFARTSKLPRAPQRTSASSDVSILSSCERGMPPFTLSPKTRGQRTSFAAISWLRSGTRGTPGAPPAAHRQEPGSAPSVSGAPLTDRTRFARTSKLPRAPQRTSASSDVSILSSCERGMPPFTLSPKTRGQRTSFAAISWLRSGTRGTPGAPPAAHRQEPGSAPSVRSGAPLTDRPRPPTGRTGARTSKLPRAPLGRHS